MSRPPSVIRRALPKAVKVGETLHELRHMIEQIGLGPGTDSDDVVPYNTIFYARKISHRLTRELEDLEWSLRDALPKEEKKS